MRKGIRKKLFEDNRGVSLVEILVAMAIMVVITTSSVTALSYIARGDIKKATKTLYSAISSNQTYAKAKSGQWEFRVGRPTGTVLVLQSVNQSIAADGTPTGEVIYDEQEMSDRVSAITVEIYSADGSAVSGETDLTSITFKKNTGAVDTINAAAVPSGGFANITVNISGNRLTLRLYFMTGKIEQV